MRSVTFLSTINPISGIGTAARRSAGALRSVAGDRYDVDEFIASTPKRLARFRKLGFSFRELPYRVKWWRIRTIHRTLPPCDLIHLQDPTLIELAFHRRPLVITVHDLMPLALREAYRPGYSEAFVRRIEKILLADRIVVDSEFTAADLERRCRIPREKIRIVPLGVDPPNGPPRSRAEARKALGLPLDKTLILNVGTERPAKNIAMLLRVYREVRRDHPEVLLVRVGKTHDAVDALIEREMNGVPLIRTGRLEKDISLYYAAADFYICLDLYAGFGLPNLEAMAAGCPVVTSNRTSLPEVCGDAPLYVDPEKPEEIGEAICRYLGNEALREEHRRRGGRQVLKFTWEKSARVLASVYDELIVS